MRPNLTYTPRRPGSTQGTPELAELIREGRERLGMSQGAFAEAIGKTRGYIWQLEQGQSGITNTETAQAIADLLGITADDVFAAGKFVPSDLYDLIANLSGPARRQLRRQLVSF